VSWLELRQSSSQSGRLTYGEAVEVALEYLAVQRVKIAELIGSLRDVYRRALHCSCGLDSPC